MPIDLCPLCASPAPLHFRDGDWLGCPLKLYANADRNAPRVMVRVCIRGQSRDGHRLIAWADCIAQAPEGASSQADGILVWDLDAGDSWVEDRANLWNWGRGHGLRCRKATASEIDACRYAIECEIGRKPIIVGKLVSRDRKSDTA
jgi:hypothetical protein